MDNVTGPGICTCSKLHVLGPGKVVRQATAQPLSRAGTEGQRGGKQDVIAVPEKKNTTTARTPFIEIE